MYSILLIEQELFVKGLANSKTFQRFAVRTDATLRNVKESSNEAMNAKLDELHKTATKTAFSQGSTFHSSYQSGASTASKGTYHTNGPPKPPNTGFAGFIEAMGKEVQKDLGIGK